jgi:serine/threonine protein kinase
VARFEIRRRILEGTMSNGGAQAASGTATYRTARELGSRSPRSYAAIRDPNDLVVIYRFTRAADPKAKSTASVVAGDGGISLGTDAMATLLRDARCLAKNWHPNIARVRHVDVAGDDVTVATELVDGTTLGDLISAAAAHRAAAGRGSDDVLLPLPVIVRILVDVLAGLHGLHSLRDGASAPLGTLHGALSPANIVVGKDGVARIVNALRPRPLRLAAGTDAVGYAAPEALDVGASQDVRADLHAVGVVMWEALSGRRLYDEHEPARVLARQREEDVPPPAFPANSPFARLADVTMRAIAFDPSLRFKTANEMGAALRNIAGTRIATGSVVATCVAELAGERIRARRIELDPAGSGTRRRPTEPKMPVAKAAPPAQKAAAVPVPVAPEPQGERVTRPPGSNPAIDVAPPPSEREEISIRELMSSAPPVHADAMMDAPAMPPPPRAPGSSPALPVATLSAAKRQNPPPMLRKVAPAAAPQPTAPSSPAPSPPTRASAAAEAFADIDEPGHDPAPPARESTPSVIIAPDSDGALKSSPALPAPQPPQPPQRVPAPMMRAPAPSTPERTLAPVVDPARHKPTGPMASKPPPPQRRTRAVVGMLVGCAIAFLIIVFGFGIRAMLTGPKPTGANTTTSASAGAASTAMTPAATTGEPPSPIVTAPPVTAAANEAAEANANANANAQAPAPTQEAEPAAMAKDEASPATAPTATSTHTTTNEAATPAPGNLPKPAPAGSGTKPKKRTYEPLGI